MRISHLEAKYGIEEIEDVLEPSEFETGLIQEPTPDSSHIDDAIVLRDNLGAIAEQVEEHPEVALEHYHWSVKQILGTKSVPMPRNLGLENFGDTARDRRSFIREIRSLENHLDSNIQISLEAYSEAVDKQLKTALAENVKINKALEDQLKKYHNKPVIVANKSALGIFVKDNEFITSIRQVKETAEGSINDICFLVKQLRSDMKGSKLNAMAFYRKHNSSVELLMNYQIQAKGDSVTLVEADWNAEDVIERVIKGKAIKELIESGIWFAGSMAAAGLSGPMGLVFGYIGGAAASITGLVAWFKGLHTMVKSATTHGQIGSHSDRLAKRDYSSFTDCAKVVLNLSKDLDKIVKLNDELKSDDLEHSVKLQRVLLEGVKYVNALQYNVKSVYERSASMMQ